MAIFFALITFFAWGGADVFAALSSRKIGNLGTFIIIQLVGICLFAVLYPFFAGTYDFFYFLIAFVLAVIDNLGLLFFYKAFEEGNVPLNGTIAGSFGLVIVIIALVFFGEKLTVGVELGIVFVFFGIVLSSLRLKELFRRNLGASFSDKGVLYAILTMIFWGIYFGFLRIPTEKIGWYWTMVPLSFMLPFIIFFGKVRNTLKNIAKGRTNLRYGVLHSLTAYGGTIAFNLGIMRGNSSVVGPISAASPALFVVLSRFIFKDKLTRQQWMGILMALVGIVLISLS